MRLHIDPKYFFPVIGGVTFFLFIVIAVYSIDYSERQKLVFESSVRESGILDTAKVILLKDQSAFALSELKGKPILLLFWAGWSEKSIEYLRAVSAFRDQNKPETIVVAALVKDAAEMNTQVLSELNQVLHISGTALYGQLKVTGIPSVITFDSTFSIQKVSTGDDRAGIPALFEHE